MGKTYRKYDPGQSYLLPPDIRDWLPENHLARFIDNVVDELDLSPIFGYYEREERGYPPYNPTMMTKILLYAYCIGMPSSRKIDKSMYEDIAFRYLGAGNFPNFRTISDFRKIHLDTLKDLFVQVLQLCNEAGLVKLGTVALDGTKVKANASLKKTRKYSKICEMEKIVEKKLMEAKKVDEEEDRIYGKDRRGDELPNGFQTEKERLERIREAKRQLEEEQKDRYEEYKRKLRKRKKKEDETGKTPRGRKLKEVEEEPDNESKGNITDPDSRIMKTQKGFIQGYNGQVVVDCDSQVIVGADLVQDHNDKHQQIPMMRQVEDNTDQKPKACVMDTGYWDEPRLRQIDNDIELYVSTEKDWKEWKKMRDRPSPRGRIPNNITYKERMERKLLTKKGRAVYKRRKMTVEPVIGQIKNRGFDKLLLRGLTKANGEWTLICLSHNLLKLWKASITG